MYLEGAALKSAVSLPKSDGMADGWVLVNKHNIYFLAVRIKYFQGLRLAHYSTNSKLLKWMHILFRCASTDKHDT